MKQFNLNKKNKGCLPREADTIAKNYWHQKKISQYLKENIQLNVNYFGIRKEQINFFPQLQPKTGQIKG